MAGFLRAYRSASAGAAFLPRTGETIRAMIEAFLLEKALYELRYELDHRPEWVRIPAAGILSLLPGRDYVRGG
jgi:maltose alpha-D-glucosyltransferase/alpha-amylase